MIRLWVTIILAFYACKLILIDAQSFSQYGSLKRYMIIGQFFISFLVTIGLLMTIYDQN